MYLEEIASDKTVGIKKTLVVKDTPTLTILVKLILLSHGMPQQLFAKERLQITIKLLEQNIALT